ncbi:MAG: tetratricopeptide repeat protein [Rhodospirillaceae bacterium]
MLPSYCKYTQMFETHVPGGQNKAQQDRLKALMGNTFYALHHYCWGLMNTNRGVLLARTAQYRQLYLRASITEFDYVIQRAPQDFVLLPEILTRKGENLIRLGQGSFAVPELRRAMELKPDYWPPYAALSDYYKSAGQADQAREILEKGLAVMPGEKALKARLSSTAVPKHTSKRSE